jgi:hypothetical protein
MGFGKRNGGCQQSSVSLTTTANSRVSTALTECRGASARTGKAVRPPSLTNQRPQGTEYSRKKWRVSGRPLSRAGSLPQDEPTKPTKNTKPSVSSPCKLLMLLLIHPPLRKAEWRHSSGEWARSAVRRSRTHRKEVQRSKPEAMSPDGCRSEGTPSQGEGPDAWGEPFWLLLCRLTKGTRRKGETISRHYRSNGYVHPQNQSQPPGRHRWQASSYRDQAHREK